LPVCRISLVYRVFVSHSSRNTVSAVAVTRWLIENEPSLDGEIYLDVDPQKGIAPGTRWKAALVQAVDRCEVVICLISPEWEDSSECQTEYRYAENLNKRIFCARLDPRASGDMVREWQICDLFPDGQGLTTPVPSQNGAPVVFSSDGLYRLLRGLREAGIGAEHFPWPPEGDPGRAPYRGWQPMEDADAAVFFGRDQQILRGLDALRGMRTIGVEGLFVVLGPSGVGKSSFLRAGLLPRLRRDRKNFLVCDIVRPERAAVTGDQGLAQAIGELRSRAGVTSPALGDIKAACLAGDAGRLTNWLREARHNAVGDGLTPTLVLPIDQAEELFAADAGPEAAQCLTLLGSLLKSAAIAELPIIAVATIRADRYGSLQIAPQLDGVHAREFGELKPMPLTEFKEVITGPAARATAAGLRLSLDAALVDRLLADASGGADSLPLLALTLSRLYLDYGSTERLTLANYEAMGGMQRVVETEIDTLLAADPDQRAQQLDTLRAAFIPWLATVDPHTDQPSRRVARWDELPRSSHDLINAMVARRLLVKDERGGDTVVEVALESLFRQWDSLAHWLREQAEDLKKADNLDRAAADWERNERSPEWLIEGVRLAAAEQLANSPVFADRVRHAAEFLWASREREDAEADAERQRRETELRSAQQRRDEAEAHAAALRKRTRVQRVLLALMLVVALVAVTTSVLAVLANRRAELKRREADAERLSSQAQAMLAGGQPGSELIALNKLLAAQRISANPDIGALLTALRNKAKLQTIFAVPPRSFLSDDGQRIVKSTDSGIQILDAETGAPLGERFPVAKTDYIFGLSPDGHYVAIGSGLGPDGRYISTESAEHSIRVWDSASRQFVGQPMPLGEMAPVSLEDVRHGAVSPDGRRVAGADGPGTLAVWDTETGRQIATSQSGEGSGVTSVAFSRDGHHLASTHYDGTVRLWDPSSGASLHEPLRGGDPRVARDVTYSVAFSADGRTIAAGGTTVGQGTYMSAGSPLRLWSADGVPIGEQVIGNYGNIYAVAFSPNGNDVVTGGSDRTLLLWDAHTGQLKGLPLTFQEPLKAVGFTPHGNRIVAISGDTVQVTNADSNAGLVAEITGSTTAHLAQLGAGYGINTTTDSPRITVLSDGTFRQLDADTGDQIGQIIALDVLQDWARATVSPDSRWLAVVGQDNAIRVIDTSNGQPQGRAIAVPLGQAIAVPQGPDLPPPGLVTTIEFSPDGNTLATGSHDGIRLWDWRNGRQLGETLTDRNYYDFKILVFSKDGSRLFSQSFDSIGTWDTVKRQAIGKPIGGREGPYYFDAMALSNNGQRIAASYQNKIQQWDATTGEKIGPEMNGHNQRVEDIAYSPDDRYLVSVSSLDHTLRFWNADTESQIGEPLDTTAVGDMSSIQFSHDGRRVFVTATAASLDNNPPFVGGGIWTLPGPAAWADALCAKLVTNMSHQQWRDWVSPGSDIGYTTLCPNLPSASMDREAADMTSERIHRFGYLAGRVMALVVMIAIPIFLIVRARSRRKTHSSTPRWGQVGASARPQWRFNPPPGWPPTPPGFVPPPGWRPDPSWPAAPPGWQWWTPNL